MDYQPQPTAEAFALEEREGDAPRSARAFSLAEKLRIVREANAPGVTFRHVEQKYGLGKNVLAYWRRAYRDLSESMVSGAALATADAPDLAALRLQVERLERLLGQKTLELELLRERLRTPDGGSRP